MTYKNLEEYLVESSYFDNGGLWSAGGGSSGQLGNNGTSSASTPVQTISVGTNWKQVSCGYNYTAAIKTTGELWLWGSNDSCQLGRQLGLAVPGSSPMQTTVGGTNWKQVSCGAMHTAAVKTDGTLWTWGSNTYMQLGRSASTSGTTFSTPMQTTVGGTNWRQVAAGKSQTAAIKTDGTIWCWGWNLFGELGDSTNTQTSTPVQVVGAGAPWKQVACGSYHTAAINTNGELWSWGQGTRLGTVSTTDKNSPVQTAHGGTNWKQVACGDSNTAAIKTNGELWIWGANQYGSLGNNSTTTSSTPVQTSVAGTNWRQVDCGETHTVAIKTNGELWTWGFNTSGQLCDGTTVHKSNPVQTSVGGTNWKKVAAGGVTVAINESWGLVT